MSKFKYVVTEQDAEQPIKAIIRKNFRFSSKMMSRIKNNNLVSLNGQAMPGWIVAFVGDVIEIDLPEEVSIFPAEDIPLDIIYEDEDLIVINKQQNVIVHPTKGQPNHTMANAIMNYMQNTEQTFKIHFVNRLDRDTTGLLLVAKNAYVQQELIAQMSQDKVRKIYYALCCGIMEDFKGKIEAPIGRLESGKVARGILPENLGGFASVTHYEVLERFNYKTLKLSKAVTSGLGANGENLGIDKEDLRKVYDSINQDVMNRLKTEDKVQSCDGISYCKLRLETGRTHQIRVHMGSINHHVVGDTLYGGILGNMCESNTKFVPLLERQALHAGLLAFTHPITREYMEFEAPLPYNFQNLLDKLRKD